MLKKIRENVVVYVKKSAYVIYEWSLSVPLHLVRKLLSPDSILLKKLGQTLKFEIAIGMNGRIWARANEPKETICIANAIWAAEHMTNNEIKPMVDRLSDALAGF